MLRRRRLDGFLRGQQWFSLRVNQVVSIGGRQLRIFFAAAVGSDSFWTQSRQLVVTAGASRWRIMAAQIALGRYDPLTRTDNDIGESYFVAQGAPSVVRDAVDAPGKDVIECILG